MNEDMLLLIVVLVIGAIILLSGAGIIKLPQSPPASQEQTVQIGSEKPKEEKPAVALYVGNSGWSDDPNQEYIEIQADYNNKKAVNITGWKLKNKNNETFAIPYGAKLVYSASVNPQENITLAPGQKAVIVTGKNPIVSNFLLNKCIGYFNQQYNFYPSIYQSCPYPKDEPGAANQKDACIIYLRSLPACRAPQNIPLFELNNDCREFIAQNVSYAGCVKNHKNDSDFFGSEWRIYLEQNNKIWSNVSEKIQLFDQNLNLAAEISY